MRILVIGGAGMLGRALTTLLRQRGHHVSSFDVQPCSEPGVESLVGDVRDLDALQAACAGKDAVIHTAVMVNQLPGKQALMYEINVGGVLNTLAACQAHGVPRLIYTSSVDVVFDGTPIRDGDESLPYPKTHLDYYGETKMLAEQQVIAANGVSGVTTCSLRSAGLYGAGDKHRFPNIIPVVIKSGRLTRIGDGHAKFNHLYVENMAYALTLAAEHLTPTSPSAGQCYFITDYAPGNFFAFFEPYLKALHIPYKIAHLPESAAMLIARTGEAAYALSGKAPLLTRYAVAATARDFWFNSQKAARDLGYAPLVSESDAFERTLAWARDFTTGSRL